MPGLEGRGAISSGVAGCACPAAGPSPLLGAVLRTGLRTTHLTSHGSGMGFNYISA
eukprot:CAMPEP_0172613972 /NCGR_PEP_ID=MMETSP1068-20121228/49110_1 /TAXON_ID=35684 /ORGANISM="Pseudopedinella elastica, Strain CCMP716" /LENGTH=55 /DNA_ID=CAMNT_0013418615 /DNA_START=130 /DNA_END=297 /DNA_ORIENTATION=+